MGKNISSDNTTEKNKATLEEKERRRCCLEWVGQGRPLRDGDAIWAEMKGESEDSGDDLGKLSRKKEQAVHRLCCRWALEMWEGQCDWAIWVDWLSIAQQMKLTEHVTIFLVQFMWPKFCYLENNCLEKQKNTKNKQTKREYIILTLNYLEIINDDRLLNNIQPLP